MAQIVAGIGSSHVPTFGPAYDGRKFAEPDWKPLFEGYAPVKAWLESDVKPDVAVVIYNDHGSDFSLDRVPTFAIGVRDEYQQADEGFGERPLPRVPGDASLAWHLAMKLIESDFDMTVCQEMKVDHGLLAPLPLLFSHEANWSVKVVPLIVNVIQHPLPSAQRCFDLGRALARAIASWPAHSKVVVVGTGGMSHQLHGERFGMINSEFDRRWLELIENDPEALCRLSHLDIMQNAGAESVELIMWLVMRGALPQSVTRRHVNYYAPMTTGMGLISLIPA
jgi:hypothetical protein